MNFLCLKCINQLYSLFLKMQAHSDSRGRKYIFFNQVFKLTFVNSNLTYRVLSNSLDFILPLLKWKLYFIVAWSFICFSSIVYIKRLPNNNTNITINSKTTEFEALFDLRIYLSKGLQQEYNILEWSNVIVSSVWLC